MGEPFDSDRVFDSLQDVFGDLFGRTAAPRGDVSLRVTITLVEAAHGAKLRVEIPTTTRCTVCSGSGGAPGAQRLECRVCGGSGKQRATERHAAIDVSCLACAGRGKTWTAQCAPCGGRGTIETRSAVNVSIPAGIADGATLRLPGRGNEHGEKRGDVFVSIEVAPHPRLRRAGDDLQVRMPFDPERARRGDTLSVPWLEGPARVPMPAGSKAGDVLRLPGWGTVKLGAPVAPPPTEGTTPYRSGTPGRGDLLVTLVGEDELVPAYETLGLRPGAGRREIDRAYRRLMQVYTPVTDDTRLRVARIEGAYAELALVEGDAPPAAPTDARSVVIVAGVLGIASVLAYLFLR